MSAEAIASKIVSHLNGMKDQSHEARLAYYERLRATLVQSAGNNKTNLADTNSLIEQAIRLAEIDFVPLETHAGGRFALKVATACAGFAGLADFLEPIVDVKTVSMAISALVVIATWAGIRFMPEWSGRLRLTRNVGLALIATTAGLFGVQSVFSNGAPNGAIAEVFPPIVELQNSIIGLRQDVAEVKKDTETIIEQGTQTLQITENIERSTGEISQGVETSNQQIDVLRRETEESAKQLRNLILNDTFFNERALKNRWDMGNFGANAVGGGVLSEDDGFDQASIFAVRCTAGKSIEFEFADTGHGLVSATEVDSARFYFTIDGEEYRTDWLYQPHIESSYLVYRSTEGGTMDEVAFMLRKLSEGNFVRSYVKRSQESDWDEHGVFSLKGSSSVMENVIRACPGYADYYYGRQ